jgi:hypothetical protein
MAVQLLISSFLIKVKGQTGQTIRRVKVSAFFGLAAPNQLGQSTGKMLLSSSTLNKSLVSLPSDLVYL